MESIDYIKLADSRMTDQFRFDQAFLALVYTIIEQRAKRQQEYFSFLDTFLDIDKSEGKALDLIGSIVGQERRLVNFIQEPYFGFQGARFAEALDVGYWYSENKARIGRLKILNDQDYRKLIKARIINNRSRCTRDDLLSILNILTGNTESEVIEVSHGVFKVSIVDDINGLASYFLSKYRDKDTIFSIPLGYRMSVVYKQPQTITISATYDSFMQTMTVTGTAGVTVRTVDSLGNVLGTGTIEPSGTVTYSLNEGTTPDEDLISTSALVSSNTVNHTILTSSKFLYENVASGFTASMATWTDTAPIDGSMYVDWGDGTPPMILSFTTADDNWGEFYEHIYQNAGSYVLKVRAIGVWEGLTVQDHHKMLDWGHCTSYTIQNASPNLYEIVPNDIPYFVTSLYNFLWGAQNFNQDISHYNTSNIVDMRNTLRECHAFQQNLSSWCVSNIPSKPSGFDLGSPLFTVDKHPVWGTCP